MIAEETRSSFCFVYVYIFIRRLDRRKHARRQTRKMEKKHRKILILILYSCKLFISSRLIHNSRRRRDRAVEFGRVGRCEVSRRQSAGIWKKSEQ